MPDDVKKTFAQSMKKVFGKGEQTRFQAADTIVEISEKYGFWNSIVETCDWLVHEGATVVTSTLTVIAGYAFLNLARRYTNPHTMLRTEVDRIMGAMEHVYPELDTFLDVNLMIDGLPQPTFLQRWTYRWRNMMNRMTLGFSDTVINGIISTFNYIDSRLPGGRQRVQDRLAYWANVDSAINYVNDMRDVARRAVPGTQRRVLEGITRFNLLTSGSHTGITRRTADDYII